MHMTTRDCLTKALLDTQERVRDYMNYADQIEDHEIRQFFKSFAEIEGQHAQRLQGFIKEATNSR